MPAPYASIVLWVALISLRQQLVSDAGLPWDTALALGLWRGWLADGCAVLGVAVLARVLWLLLRVPPRAAWSILAVCLWGASLAHVLHYGFFESPLELWILRHHLADLALVAGAAAESGITRPVAVSAVVFVAALALALAGRSGELRSDRAPTGGASLRAAVVAVAMLAVALVAREGLERVASRLATTEMMALRWQVFEGWAGDVVYADWERSGWDWKRDGRRAQLASRLAEPLPEAERRRVFDTLRRYREHARPGAAPPGIPVRSEPLLGEPRDPGWALSRPLRSDPADVAALRRLFGLAPDGPLNVIAVFVESLRALELQHPDVAPRVFPRLTALLESRGIWFTQAYSSAFTAGQTVRGQFTAKCSMLPNSRGVAAYIGHPQLRITCLSQLFRKQGAETLWLNTSPSEFHSTDAFEAAHGTERVLGEEFFANLGLEERIGDWGFADRPFLQASLDVLEAAGEPFFATLLTATSHVPFVEPEGVELPPALLQRVGQNRQHRQYLSVLRYVDESLGDFFERLFASDLADRTLVVLMGDHSVGVMPYLPLSDVQRAEMRFRVPMALLSAGLVSPGPVTYPVHQLDLAPTVARIAGLTGEVGWLGRDALSGSGSPWVYRQGDVFHYRSGEHACYSIRAPGELRCHRVAPGVDPLFAADLPQASASEEELALFRRVADAASEAIESNLIEPPRSLEGGDARSTALQRDPD